MLWTIEAIAVSEAIGMNTILCLLLLLNTGELVSTWRQMPSRIRPYRISNTQQRTICQAIMQNIGRSEKLIRNYGMKKTRRKHTVDDCEGISPRCTNHRISTGPRDDKTQMLSGWSFFQPFCAGNGYRIRCTAGRACGFLDQTAMFGIQ